MADLKIEDIDKQQDDLQAAVVKEHTDVQAFIDTLKAQVAAGNNVTQAQLVALSNKIAGVTTMVTDFDVTNSTPVVVPPPIDVPPVPPAPTAR